jgi:hypothetical protein
MTSHVFVNSSVPNFELQFAYRKSHGKCLVRTLDKDHVAQIERALVCVSAFDSDRAVERGTEIAVPRRRAVEEGVHANPEISLPGHVVSLGINNGNVPSGAFASRAATAGRPRHHSTRAMRREDALPFASAAGGTAFGSAPRRQFRLITPLHTGAAALR